MLSFMKFIMILSSMLNLSFSDNCESGNGIYNLTFPPHYNSHNPDLEAPGAVNISYRFRLEQITNVNDIEGTVSMLMYIEVNWPDTRIVKDTCRGRITDEQYNKIWKPSVKFFNIKDVNVKPTTTPHGFNNVFIWKGEISWFWDLQVSIYCNFEFSNYPIDVQRCKFRLIYENHQHFDVWQRYLNDSIQQGLIIEEDKQRELKYEIEFEEIPNGDRIQSWSDYGMCGTTEDVWCISVIGFDIVMTRKITPFILNHYMPATILVVISWISFWIPIDSVPARMALLVTIYLVLTNIGTGTRVQAPSGGRASYLDIYLQTSQSFVALALFEYAFLLFYSRRIKYKKVYQTNARTERNSVHSGITIIGNFTKDLDEQSQEKHDKDLIKRTDDMALIAFPTLFAIFIIIYVASVKF